MARKFCDNAQEAPGSPVREFKRDKPRSGDGKKVTGHEQAIASGAGEARKEGSKGPLRAKAER